MRQFRKRNQKGLAERKHRPETVVEINFEIATVGGLDQISAQWQLHQSRALSEKLYKEYKHLYTYQ